MSKYNLTDIFEQYQIGSGFTSDFDYEGMLKAGLKTGVDTDIEILRKMSDDFEDVNYHRENNHLQMAIDALEEGAIKEASMFFGDFHAEIKSTMETFDMDMSDDLGAFMASKMEEDYKPSHRAYNVIDGKGNIVYKELPRHTAIEKASEREDYKFSATDRLAEDTKAVDLAIEASQEKAGIKEVRIEREVASRIEGLMNIQLKKQFLDVFEDLWLDLIEEDPFYAEDVIAHLSNEMSKQISNRQAQGDRLAGMEEGAMQPGEADLEAGVKGNMGAFTESNCEKHDYKQIDSDGTAECTKCGLRNSEPSKSGEKVRNEGKGVDFIRALKVDANGTKLEIKSYLESLKRSGDKFDDIDDYVEDFKNYVADKSLQEHFGRFMKDYQ